VRVPNTAYGVRRTRAGDHKDALDEKLPIASLAVAWGMLGGLREGGPDV
jgi:hypothetical protein